ncbi:MAG: DUF4143 domain-containing protein, partial [Cyclobacteriaceae bacterium]|nr:DUF4143 domain-containing protein [Cyclobacteriaceae bacterium]
PFSFAELKEDNFSNVENFEKLIFYGSFPRIYDKHIDPTDFYPNYIQTYVERDIRQIKNILDLDNFIKFVRLCAARVGQLLNLNSLATAVGITYNTAKSWLSVLESSYIVYRLKPYHKSFNKRLVKMQKLYFYDTGLACSLVGIENQKQLSTYYQKGELFENLVINEFIKQRYNNGKVNNLYFWRNNHGNEIDCLISQFETDMVVEIKSGATYSAGFFKNINYWNKLSNSATKDSYVVYTGDKTLKTKLGMLVSWKELDKFLELI